MDPTTTLERFSRRFARSETNIDLPKSRPTSGHTVDRHGRTLRLSAARCSSPAFPVFCPPMIVAGVKKSLYTSSSKRRHGRTLISVLAPSTVCPVRLLIIYSFLCPFFFSRFNGLALFWRFPSLFSKSMQFSIHTDYFYLPSLFEVIIAQFSITLL